MIKRTCIPEALWSKADDSEKEIINELIRDQNTFVFLMEKLKPFGVTREVVDAWRATERD